MVRNESDISAVHREPFLRPAPVTGWRQNHLSLRLSPTDPPAARRTSAPRPSAVNRLLPHIEAHGSLVIHTGVVLVTRRRTVAVRVAVAAPPGRVGMAGRCAPKQLDHLPAVAISLDPRPRDRFGGASPGPFSSGSAGADSPLQRRRPTEIPRRLGGASPGRLQEFAPKASLGARAADSVARLYQ